MEELLLWRWSTTVQITSAVVLALFMAAFGRSVGRPDTRWWAAAFLANLGAMTVTVLYWYGVTELLPNALPRFVYIASKTAFALCLTAGVFAFRDAHGRQPLTTGRIVGVSAGVALLGALLLPGLYDLGMVQQGLTAIVLGIGAVACLRGVGLGLGWLGLGLGLRALLAAAESTVYGISHVAGEAAQPDWMKLVLASHSSFDTGAEWLIVLGCVVAVARRSEDDLRRSHAELHHANQALVEAVQRDALTGLANRRALSPLLEVAGRTGANLVFFDLDDFKTINDEHGHHVGDACLKRFADSLRDHFPDVDGVVRYAGDEFVLVDTGLSDEDVEHRIDRLRAHMAGPSGGVPGLGFSVGHYRFAGGGDIQHALREADLAMYRDKAERRKSSGASASA